MKHLQMQRKNNTRTGHYFNKHASRNPLVQLLVRRYRRFLQSLIKDLPIYSALEIGSGEGYILFYIHKARPDVRLIGSDLTIDMVKKARLQEPRAFWCVAKGEHLPFASKSFDLVLACEVLEHVSDPELVLSEMQRVSRGFCLITVPNEPLWRILNVLRAQYLRSWGNTPGHIQHWSAKGITRLVSKYFRILKVKKILPWTFVLAIRENNTNRLLRRSLCS